MTTNPRSTIKSRMLSVVRRGPTEILWTPPDVRGGNVLYYWLRAASRQAAGTDAHVLGTAHAETWLRAFPRLRELTRAPHEVRMNDRRLPPGVLQHFGTDFTVDELDDFIAKYLMSSPSTFADHVAAQHGLDLTINIRHGADYYSHPGARGAFSFDVPEYVRTAVRLVAEQAPITGIRLVSDNLDWCTAKLAWLNEIAPVSVPGQEADPIDHLATLTASPRLILANSTFSYWGGYLSSWLHPHDVADAPSGVWAPSFHNRYFPDGGRATQLNPRWTIIEEIPGGWDG
ncbi:MAG: alpha-1,2-fucosyltransferase [Microbacterium sp.]